MEFISLLENLFQSLLNNIKSFQVDVESGKTNIEKVFAGGDAVRGAATVVEAVGDGKNVAKNILKDAKQEQLVESIPSKDASQSE